MINSLSVKKGKVTSRKYEWAQSVPFLQENKIVEFSPGLNILFGPNGSGKSTVAGLCAFLMAAEQSGSSAVTDTWLDDLMGFGFGNEKPVVPATLSHDGQPVLYVDPRKSVGLSCSGAFDDDFFSRGIGSMMQSRQSTGQSSASKIGHVMIF